MSGGHYTAYCLNYLNDQWYEFDDQYVTEVEVGQVINCEAYVLFYRYARFNSAFICTTIIQVLVHYTFREVATKLKNIK